MCPISGLASVLTSVHCRLVHDSLGHSRAIGYHVRALRGTPLAHYCSSAHSVAAILHVQGIYSRPHCTFRYSDATTLHVQALRHQFRASSLLVQALPSLLIVRPGTPPPPHRPLWALRCRLTGLFAQPRAVRDHHTSTPRALAAATRVIPAPVHQVRLHLPTGAVDQGEASPLNRLRTSKMAGSPGWTSTAKNGVF